MAERQPNRLLREARGSITQGRLAALVRGEIYRATGKESVITAKSISDWECGLYTWPPTHVRQALCRVLQKDDPAELGFFSKRRVRPPRDSNPVPIVDLMAGTRLGRGSSGLRIPPGRSFGGLDVEAHYCEATWLDGRWFLPAPGPDAVLSRPDRRSLIVVADEEGQHYVSDGARFAGHAGRPGSPQPVSSAQLVDDLTVGIIWAATNTDVALLADDAPLSSSMSQLAIYPGRCLSQLRPADG
ncbi:hypothetical protein GCM10009804_58400 [Kribbella hippodromi]|uniref:XRE family transcriptional regulator n=1 Tax=Kribbella hippodromi TaxID=434347 RepID=A0ABN2E3S4_9ACTN